METVGQDQEADLRSASLRATDPPEVVGPESAVRSDSAANGTLETPATRPAEKIPIVKTRATLLNFRFTSCMLESFELIYYELEGH